MTEKRFRVNELVKYNYSEIGEYIDENHTDRPLMNDKVCELLNELHEENQQYREWMEAVREELSLVEENKELQKKNEQLKEHQRTLEAKIRRLKDRVKIFEKNYSVKDKQRIKNGELKGCFR